MKYTNQSTVQLDSKIEKMFELSMPNSAFKRVIPAHVKEMLRNQCVDQQSNEVRSTVANEGDNTSRSVSTQVIKINISSLRAAGYCCCPKELAAACEQLIREQVTTYVSETNNSTKIPTENVRGVGKNLSIETADCEMNCDTETTNPKSNEVSSEIEKSSEVSSKKAYPSKLDKGDEFKAKAKAKSRTSKSHQGQALKRKYFTKYMSSEFSKDTKPVSMSMMDDKTQELFKQKEFNDLVSEITGIL
jgi:hypothetical protein